jgi:2-alkenal reductase
MKTQVILIVMAIALLGAIFASGAVGGAVAALWVINHNEPEVAAGAADSAVVAETLSSGLLTPGTEAETILNVVRDSRPAVVTVWNLQYSRASLFSPVQLMRAESGSGVIFDDRGYIATNAHVINNAEAIEVVFHDGRRATAELVRGNLVYDVAILHVNAELPGVVPLGDSSLLEPGMRVLAIGSPLGTEYQNTVTEGIIAGLGRQVKVPRFDWSTMQYREVDIVGVPLIQTDAAINSGNSGGPLINLAGEVIGLNTLIIRQNQRTTVEGLGFAVPSNVVDALADEWIDGVRRPVLEVEFETLDPVIARENQLEHSTGAVITNVQPGSAADKAGLEVGDRIVAIDSIALDLDHVLADQLWRYRGGDTVHLVVDRNGEMKELEVKLGDAAGG